MIQTQLIYCGDNLQKLRDLPEGCVDLIYIDPPFNSNRNYEVFWGDTQERRAFDDRFGAVEHYIHWMRPRVLEMYRVLKPTGSFYYHCDWHADAYVRAMLDQVFGAGRFNTQIIWRRTNAKSQSFKTFPNNHDSIFFYTKGPRYTFNRQFLPHDREYVERFYREVEPGTGRRYMADNLTAPGTRRGPSGQSWRGIDVAAKGNHWKYTIEHLEELDQQGRIVWPQKQGGVPRFKRYLDEMKGVSVDSLWTDIPPIAAHSEERLGYPTQKPLALLDRIITASSSRGDIVLDAFCGCGTTLVAAQALKRKWIGIDISPTACRVMAQRLTRVCHLREGKEFWLRDVPKTAEELRRYPHSEFQNWAVAALNTVISNGQAIANRAQVGDMGIDGRVYPADMVREKQEGYDLFGEADRWFPVQVKQKDKAGRPDIDAFETAMQRQRREKGFFIAFGFTRDAQFEIKRALREHKLEIIPITVREILDEEVHFRV
jgi:DNA modification methylase